MFNRKNLIYWILILIVLITVVLVLVLRKDKTESNFKNIINQVNTQLVDKIVYKTPDNNFDVVVEKVSSDSWVVKAEGKEYVADTVRINTMYLLSTNIKPIRVAGMEKDKWKAFNVSPDSAINVKLYSNNNVIKEFYVGKLTYIQNDPNSMPSNVKTTQPGKSLMVTYIREKDDKTTYITNGNLAFAYPSNYNTIRSQTIYSVNPNNFTELSVETAKGHNCKFTRDEKNRWLKDGILVDSARARNYIGKLRSMICNYFVDSIPAGSQPDATLTIKGNNFNPVIIKFYKHDSVGYAVTSTFNTNDIFLDRNGVLRKRIEAFPN